MDSNFLGTVRSGPIGRRDLCWLAELATHRRGLGRLYVCLLVCGFRVGLPLQHVVATAADPHVLATRLAVVFSKGAPSQESQRFRCAVRKRISAEPVHLASQPVARLDAY